MHDPSQYLFQLVTSMANLIKKNLSGTLASSLKPSSNCGWRKSVQGVSHLLRLETHCILAVLGGLRLVALEVTQSNSGTLPGESLLFS